MFTLMLFKINRTICFKITLRTLYFIRVSVCKKMDFQFTGTLRFIVTFFTLMYSTMCKRMSLPVPRFSGFVIAMLTIERLSRTFMHTGFTLGSNFFRFTLLRLSFLLFFKLFIIRFNRLRMNNISLKYSTYNNIKDIFDGNSKLSTD